MLAPEQCGAQESARVWVVFSGQTDRWWLRFLKPGFRHCFALLNDGRHWLSFDPMLHYTDLHIYADVPDSFDLPQYFKARGYVVLKARIRRDHITQRTDIIFDLCRSS